MNETELRDLFAAIALPAIIRDWTYDWEISQDADVADNIARDAYLVADAMMRARGEK